MRLLSLDLEAYGPFSGRRLIFRPDARLHVVLGPNEAGKSSALSAVTDLFFGIKAQTKYAFVHEMPNLRIGAEIAGNDGRRLAFRRRKGNRNTLVDTADKPLPDDALAPFLGGLTREVFCHAFGLDAEGLRSGGDEMMKSEGEVGASLAAAASGLRGYGVLQKALEAEADGIFGPRASKDRTFYQALRRYDEARKAAGDSTLRDGPWRALNESIAASTTLLDDLKAGRAARAVERARLERLKRVGPLVAAIDALAERAESDAGLAGLPNYVSGSWIDALDRHIAALREAGTAQETTRTALAESEREFAGVTVAEPLLARAAEILDAFGGIGGVEQFAHDLPVIRGKADGATRDLDGLAIRIGIAPALLRERQPSDAARARIDGLIRRGRDIAGTLARLTQERERRRAEQARLDRLLTAEAAPIDPAPLRADLKSFAGLRKDIDRLDGLDGAILRDSGPMLSAAARMTPPVADIAALARLPLPSQETIARCRRETESLDRAREKAGDGVEQAEKAVAVTQERLRRREAGRPIPTRAELGALRAERDRLLAALASAQGAGEPAWAVAFARFEGAVAAADRAADDLVADASRAAEQAADRHRFETEEAEAETARKRFAAAETACAAAAQAWRTAWEPSGLIPASPAEMAAWRTELDGLIETQEAVETLRAERAVLAQRIESHRAPLGALSRRAGLAELDGLSIGLALDRTEARLTSLTESWEAGRETLAGARALAEQVLAGEAEIAALRDDETRWRAGWAEAVAVIGLPAEATPDEAERALAAWSAVPATLAAQVDLLRRVTSMQRDSDAYAAKVARLVAELATDLEALPPVPAIKTLQTRLQETRAADTRRDQLDRLRQNAARQAAEAEGRAGTAQRDLADHLASAGPSAAAFAPADLHERLSARQRLRAELAGRREELTRSADGLPESALRTDLAAISVDDIEAALSRLAVEEEEAVERGQVAHAERDASERKRKELETGMGAELALAQRKAAEAEMQAAARDWAVLKVASLMLGTAISRHRAGQQDPLVTRAGVLFAGLTGGGFAGLAQDYDEADMPRIAGRRASGELVHVEGLSEGTRDQLYLALRLAYLEDYAARSEPAPFIGDDLFLTFDDARTGHGLSALASLGGAIQPILFTHHAHVAEIAQARLGEAVEVLAL